MKRYVSFDVKDTAMESGDPRLEEALNWTSALHAWSLDEGARTELLALAAIYARRAGADTPVALSTLIFNIYHDHALVQAALDAGHSDHIQAWHVIGQEIVNWLYAHDYYPQDALMLNEFSPDICAYEELGRKLVQFNFKSRLFCYVHKITETCTSEWLRSHAALKRGGSGVTSARQRRDATTAAPRWTACYLSQPAGPDSQLQWEEVLAAGDAPTAVVVEQRCLVEHIARTIDAMDGDPEYRLISGVWRDLLLDRANITALAQQLDIPAKVLFNIKSRIVRRVAPAMLQWQQGA
jgi:hypothetical protein